MQLLDWLTRIDKELFVAIHSDMAIPSLDFIFLTLRNVTTWIPLYAFMLYWCFRYNPAVLWKFLLLSILCFAVTDLSTARILKPMFARERPCFDQELNNLIRGIVNCGGHHSLPSSHAANHMGIATFWFWSVFLMSGKKWYWLYIWAFLICYAQIYVGKHYPLDIIAGLLVGWPVGIVMAKLFEKWNTPVATKREPIAM